MGYRSTFVSTPTGLDYPDWFKEKYNHSIAFLELGIIASKADIRMGDYHNEIWEDLHKALNEVRALEDNFVFYVNVISEDFVVSNVRITKENIEYFWLFTAQKAPFVWMNGAGIVVP